MFAFVFAAALIMDPGSETKAPAKEARPVAEPAAVVEPVAMPIAVTVECTAKADGLVTGCIVLGETRPGLGFGEAAVALMNGTRVDPGPRDIQFAHTIQFTP